MARRDDAFVIIARTDAIAVEGIEGAIKRARAYAEAGADMIFPDAVKSEDDVKRIVEAAGVPVTINMGFGIRERPTTPLMSIDRLAQLGVRRVSLPRMLPAAAIKGMQSALAIMQEAIAAKTTAHRPDVVSSIEDIMELMDYENVHQLEDRLLRFDDAAE